VLSVPLSVEHAHKFVHSSVPFVHKDVVTLQFRLDGAKESHLVARFKSQQVGNQFVLYAGFLDVFFF
jgi:hypothetical protein